MATADEPKGQMEAMQQQLKDLSVKKMVYAKDRKFGKLNKDTDVSEWIEHMGDFVKNLFSVKCEKVRYILIQDARMPGWR